MGGHAILDLRIYTRGRGSRVRGEGAGVSVSRDTRVAGGTLRSFTRGDLCPRQGLVYVGPGLIEWRSRVLVDVTTADVVRAEYGEWWLNVVLVSSVICVYYWFSAETLLPCYYKAGMKLLEFSSYLALFYLAWMRESTKSCAPSLRFYQSDLWFVGVCIWFYSVHLPCSEVSWIYLSAVLISWCWIRPVMPFVIGIYFVLFGVCPCRSCWSCLPILTLDKVVLVVKSFCKLVICCLVTICFFPQEAA